MTFVSYLSRHIYHHCFLSLHFFTMSKHLTDSFQLIVWDGFLRIAKYSVEVALDFSDQHGFLGKLSLRTFLSAFATHVLGCPKCYRGAQWLAALSCLSNCEDPKSLALRKNFNGQQPRLILLKNQVDHCFCKELQYRWLFHLSQSDTKTSCLFGWRTSNGEHPEWILASLLSCLSHTWLARTANCLQSQDFGSKSLQRRLTMADWSLSLLGQLF